MSLLATPPFVLLTVPCLSDNYAFLLHDPVDGATALVDAPEAAPIGRALAAQGWSLSEIWLTHHHGDHIAGVPDLVAATGARVTGASADAHRLPPLDRAVTPGSAFSFAGQAVRVMDAPGHTLGHIAFHLPAPGLAFTGDSLMAGGCGRLFEGTPAQMWDTLSQLAALPDETLICSGHEYTESNLRFAVSLEPDNAALIFRQAEVGKARADGRATVPSRLADERATNPFLRAALPSLRTITGLDKAGDVAVFAEIRARKDRY
jgi:hydroxyacylglutathione hydrolase